MTGRRLFLISADDGAKTFFTEKNDGARTFFYEKNDGAKAFFCEKNDGAGTFFGRKNDGAKTFFEAEKILLPSIRSNKFCPLPNDFLKLFLVLIESSFLSLERSESI